MRIILPAVLAVFALAACGKSPEEPEVKGAPAPATPVVAQSANNPSVPPGIEKMPPRTAARAPRPASAGRAAGDGRNSEAQADNQTSESDAPVDFDRDDSSDAEATFRGDEAETEFPSEGRSDGWDGPRGDEVPVIGWEGIDGFDFGTDVEEFRERWEGPLEGDENGECFYLSAETGNDSARPPALMFEEGRFVRFDVESPELQAPGGGEVGMHAAGILELYGDAVERRPHKYVDGEYLRIQHPDSGQVLLFETDEQDVVTSWRMGIAPQIDYVEGCS